MEETYAPSFHEICTKINNAKDKTKKIQSILILTIKKYINNIIEGLGNKHLRYLILS